MRKTKIASAIRRAIAVGIFGFSVNMFFRFDLGGGADCVTDSTAIVSVFFNLLPPISIFYNNLKWIKFNKLWNHPFFLVELTLLFVFWLNRMGHQNYISNNFAILAPYLLVILKNNFLELYFKNLFLTASTHTKRVITL